MGLSRGGGGGVALLLPSETTGVGRWSLVSGQEDRVVGTTGFKVPSSRSTPGARCSVYRKACDLPLRTFYAISL